MNKLYNDTAVQAIANAIRAKNGSSDTYTIAEMSTALNDLSYYAKPVISNVPLATFEADGLPLNSLKASIKAQQDLSHGVPSPTNICPISGWDAAIVTDTDDVDNPTVTQTTTISLGQTVYGGELDVVNGTSGNKLTDVLQTITSVIRNNGTSYYVIPTQGAAKSENFTTVISDKLPTASNPSAVGVYINNVGAIRINTPDSYESASEMMQAYGGEINVRYELETPTTFETQPTLIKSLNGTNNLSVDCGEVIELEYFKEV